MGTIANYIGNVARAIVGQTDESRSGSGSIEDPNTSVWDGIANAGGSLAESGTIVTKKKTLSIPAFWQAVSMISGDVAKLPLGTYRRLDRGGRTLDRKHHAFKAVNLVGMANEETNAYKFWRRFVAHGLIWQNAYAWIDKNGRDEILGLYNLLPDRTSPCRIKGRLQYVTETNGKLIVLDPSEVLHVEGLSLDCMGGIDLVENFKDLFGVALAKRNFASNFFKRGMQAGGILHAPPGTKAETVRKLRRDIEAKFSSSENAFRTMVLRDNFKWVKTQIDPQQAQLTEWHEQDVREIARMFNVRASKLSVADSVSYNSEEAAKRDYHDGTLSHWLIAIRCEANAKLRTPDERQADETFFDYNINALNWADAKTAIGNRKYRDSKRPFFTQRNPRMGKFKSVRRRRSIFLPAELGAALAKTPTTKTNQATTKPTRTVDRVSLSINDDESQSNTKTRNRHATRQTN